MAGYPRFVWRVDREAALYTVMVPRLRGGGSVAQWATRSRVGCRPVVSVPGKVVLLATDSGVVEDKTERDRVAVGVA